MVSQGTEAGIFAEQEEGLVAAVFRLGDLRLPAWSMTPRTEIDWLDLDAPPAEIQNKIIASTYSRFPVARGSLDNVAGVVHTRDLLPRCLAGQPLDLVTALQPALFVPETTPALHLLESFRRSGESMCLIIDEYGGLQGLVTVTDIRKRWWVTWACPARLPSRTSCAGRMAPGWWTASPPSTSSGRFSTSTACPAKTTTSIRPSGAS